MTDIDLIAAFVHRSLETYQREYPTAVEDIADMEAALAAVERLKAAEADRSKEWRCVWDAKIGPNDTDWLETKQRCEDSEKWAMQVARACDMPTRRNVRVEWRYKAGDWQK